MKLTGRLLEIATGQASLPVQTIRKYRDLLQAQGLELPQLENHRFDTSTGKKGCCRKNKSHSQPMHRPRGHRTFWGSLTPGCGFLGKYLGKQQCNCPSRAGVELFECGLLKTQRDTPRKTVLRQMEWHSLLGQDEKQAILCCETCPHRAPPRWIPTSQLIADTIEMVSALPEGITAVAGHARSGMLPAVQAAMLLHVPLFMVRSHHAFRDVVPCGNGWRLDQGAPQHRGTLLVMDDNCMTGNSLTRLRPVVHQWAQQAGFTQTVEAVIYTNPLAQFLPERYHRPVSWPCYYEWNFFNSTFSPGMALDFDGILCEDCRPEDDDDGPRYLQFLEHTRPKYLPKREPIPLIVTARLEKYRPQTMSWLAKHGLRVKRLVMYPGTHASRSFEAIVRFKAAHFEHFHKRFPPNIRVGSPVFVESDDQQAQSIAEISKGTVICPATASVYRGR